MITPIIQPVQVSESYLILETIIDDIILEKQNMLVETEGTILEDQNISTDDEDLLISLRNDVKTCTKRPKYPLSHFIPCDNLSNSYRSFLGHLNTSIILKTATEALDRKEWREAMKVEMDALEKNGTWKLVELPKNKKLVGCKWVFTLKYKVKGTLERYKSRLVAKRYT